MAKKNTRREFSYTRPILIGGDTYPATDSFIIDENGNKTKGKIFTDANGQYYTMDGNNNISPVMISQPLDGVTVSAQNLRKYPSFLEQNLTLSNDNTKVENAPHREYNTHLKENAERGAREHATWDKEHPNAAAWRNFATAIPFGVAAIPLVVGAGSTLLSTGIGQAAKYGLTTLMENPFIAGANDVLGLGFAGKGMYDISQGKFTPETAMDIAGGYGLMFKGFNSLENFAKRMKAARNIAEEADLGLTPSRVENTESLLQKLQDPNALERIRRDTNAEGIFNRTLQEQRAAQESTAPARLLDDYDAMVADDIELPFPNSNYRFVSSDPVGLQEVDLGDLNSGASEAVRSMEGNRVFELSKDRAPIEPMPQQSDYLAENMDNYWNDLWAWERRNHQPLRTRNAGERPYTEEEINSLFNEDGTLKAEFNFKDFNDIYTGAHGMNSWVHSDDSPKEVLKHYFETFENAQKERKDISSQNQLQGMSGIGIHTHDNDTSIDSTPLLYLKIAKDAKHYHPIKAKNPTVSSNGLGVQGLFPGIKDPSVIRAKKLLQSNPDADVRLINDADGNMIAFELEDADGVFQIPINSREQVLNRMNKALHTFNRKFGTNYPDIVPKKNIFDKLSPWHYGEEFTLPNIYGIAYKKGGRLTRRLYTQL